MKITIGARLESQRSYVGNFFQRLFKFGTVKISHTVLNPDVYIFTYSSEAKLLNTIYYGNKIAPGIRLTVGTTDSTINLSDRKYPYYVVVLGFKEKVQQKNIDIYIEINNNRPRHIHKEGWTGRFSGIVAIDAVSEEVYLLPEEKVYDEDLVDIDFSPALKKCI